MTDNELRAEAAKRGMVLTSQEFWEAAANAIRFMDAEVRERKAKAGGR